MDRYIRHGDSREELEVPEYIADTCSHDGASLPGKTRFDQTCNSLSFFLYLFLVLEREKRRREKSRLVLNLTRENRRLITRDKLYTVGWRERRKDYVTIVTEITRSTFISNAYHKISFLHDRTMTSNFGLTSIINNPFFVFLSFFLSRFLQNSCRFIKKDHFSVCM